MEEQLVTKICLQLRKLLENAISRNLAEGILLSGGLDTSILAYTARKYVSLKAFTVAFNGAPASDVRYARLMANMLKLKLFAHFFDETELFEAFPVVAKSLNSFDPMQIRNEAAIYIALKLAKENDVHTVMTGDGGDELFAGYNWLFDLEKEKLDLELQRMWDSMTFGVTLLADKLSLEARLPFLDPSLKSYAMKLGSRYKVRIERGMVWGKWILRKAFEPYLPEEIVWRIKSVAEVGSGTHVLPSFFNRKISDAEFDEERRKYLEDDKVFIRDKEHLFYYKVYRSVVGVPHPKNLKSRKCPQCNSNVPRKTKYCRTCGAYPI